MLVTDPGIRALSPGVLQLAVIKHSATGECLFGRTFARRVINYPIKEAFNIELIVGFKVFPVFEVLCSFLFYVAIIHCFARSLS